MSSDLPQGGIPERLKAAMAAAGFNLSSLSRAWAERDGTQPESKRRLLQKYLDGTRPREPAARALAQLLATPADYFITAEIPRVSTVDILNRIEEIRELLLDIRGRLDADGVQPTSTVMNQVETTATRLHEAAETAPPEDLEGLELAARRLAEANRRVADSIAERRRGLGARR